MASEGLFSPALLLLRIKLKMEYVANIGPFWLQHMSVLDCASALGCLTYNLVVKIGILLA